ncbi:MAG: F0F1 ATP synthase subunit B [Planctomycetaceae bacterium]|nr:F0F1 ATP synthase subunit B [Planctomycetaceae bacterium]
MFLRLLMVMLLSFAACGASVACAEDVHHASEAGEADHPPELPGFAGDLAIWSFVTFLVFLFVVSKLAWEPLGGALSAREAKISGDIAAAEANRHKAEALLRDYEAKIAKTHDEVKEILAEARRDAEHTKQEIVAAAQREAEANRQRAVADIEQAKNTALTELFDFVSSNVMQATQNVLQRSLTGDDQERLVREALADLNVRRN